MGDAAVTRDPRSSEPMKAIVRVAVVSVTTALFFSALFNALLGVRDIAIVLALATPLGISAWGFSRAGQHEAAVALLCCVLVTVVTLTLVLNPLGVHDMSVTAYGGVVLVAALLLTSRRGFFAVLALTFVAASLAFGADLLGHSRSRIPPAGRWPQYIDFLVITSVFAVLGRYASERLFSSLRDAHHASSRDPVTGLLNRPGFLMAASMRLRAAQAEGGYAALVVVDIDDFRRINLVVGQQAADHLLAEAARRFSLAGGEGEYLFGRVGDDEFAALGVGIAEAQAPGFARNLHEALQFEHMGVSVRNAAGFARFPRDAHGIEPLLLAALSGVAHAKEQEEQRISGPADRI